MFSRRLRPPVCIIFFFNDTATTEIYTLSLHDALPISEEEIPDQSLARRDLLVGKHVPGAQLQPSGLDQGAHVTLTLRPGAQIVLDQDGLAVEQEAAVRRIGLQSLHQVVHDRNETGLECGARQIPLAIPVRVRDEMKDQSGHGAPKPKGLTALPRAAILRPMIKRALLALPALAGIAVVATRLVPGPLRDGSTLLPSGWRIRPAGRVVAV